MILRFQNLSKFIAISAVCSLLLLPTLTSATNNNGGDDTPRPNGLIVGIRQGTYGENDWYITKPSYGISFKCGGAETNGDWQPDEGKHSYEWGQNLGITGTYYLKTDNGEWTRQGGTGTLSSLSCGNDDPNIITTVKTISNLRIDTIAPALTLSTPYEGEAFQQSSIILTGRASDQTSGLASLTMDGAPMNISANGDFSTNLTKDPGVYSVAFVAKDMAGNTTLVTRTFKILENTTSASTTANIQSPSANAPSASTSTSNKNPSNTTSSQVAAGTTIPATAESVAPPVNATTSESTAVALSTPGNQVGQSETASTGSVKGVKNENTLPVAGTAVAVSSLGGLAFFLVRKFVFKI